MGGFRYASSAIYPPCGAPVALSMVTLDGREYIDALYEEKHCSRSWTKTSTAQNLGREVAQLKISDEEKHNSGRAGEEKQNSRRPDEEKHNSDDRTSIIYCILINSTPYG